VGAVGGHQHQRSRDLFLQPAGLWLWCLPGCAAIGASVLEGSHRLSMTAVGVVWTIATLWIGIACAWNARRCGRLHCLVDGTLLPALAVIGALNVVGILPMSWNIYWAVFGAVLVAGFISEILRKSHYI
jgi:hypothetical protein